MSLVKDFKKHRRYWVVSPNVGNNEATVGDWRQASVVAAAAFMGYGPDDKDGQSQGPKFAGKIENGINHGDVILIARRREHKPEIVGFGVVHGKYAKSLDGIKPPESFGSLRRLQPFEPWSRPPSGIPLINVLQHTKALVQLYPEEAQRDPKKYNAHKEVCEWIDRKLGINGKEARKMTDVTTKSKATGDISLY
jgi:hypothetical protein